MIEKNNKGLKISTKYWICKIIYQGGEVKVKGKDDVNGKHQRSAHQKCNSNLSLCRNFLLCLIIWQTIIHILSIEKWENIALKHVIAKNNEKIYELNH